MKIIVIGKSGQLAWELARLKIPDVELMCLGRKDIDITNKSAIASCLLTYQADTVINAAAYTAVDLAESDAEQAYLINSTAVSDLAEVCAEQKLHFVHVSTDFVFGGGNSRPYLSSDQYSPLGIYGASKAVGEQCVMQTIPESSCILRTSWVYSSHGNNFVKSMLRLMAEKEQLGVVADQIGTPTYAQGLAEACLFAAMNKVTGIHHWTDEGIASWYDFAVAIQSLALEEGLLNTAIPLKAINTDAYPAAAKRPSYSVLDKSSLAADFPSLARVHWRAQLHTMLKELDKE